MSSHPPLWSLAIEQVYATLATSAQGLDHAEALQRLQHYGYNELPEPPQRSLWLRFTDQLTHFMALLLWAAGILAFISRTPELGWAIWAVIWINAIFSFWQEFQAERALSALKQVLPVQVRVFREGELQQIPARELVPGDVVQLEEGDRISADARMVAAESFYVDVSVLTGESLPVARHARPVQERQVVPVRGGKTILHPGESPAEERVQPAEVPNLVFAGSTVSAGRGVAVVYATGGQTEFGQVAHLTTMVKREPSTLEVQIARIVRVITAIAVGMGITVFLLSYFLIGMGARESFIFAIGIIVANVPEGLLPTVTLALALSVQRMARRNALVRRLSAVETLSATTVICTDKTGTLTKNEMTVRALWVPDGEEKAEGRRQKAEGKQDGEIVRWRDSEQAYSPHHPTTPFPIIPVTGAGYDPSTGSVEIPPDLDGAWRVQLLLAGAALCSNARLVHLTGPSRWQEIGDPTEAALLVAAIKAGLSPESLQQQAPRLREVPFDSRRRMMTVVLDWRLSDLWANEFPSLSFTKGAPLEVLRHCHSILGGTGVQELTPADREAIAAANDHLAEQGYRVLGVAVRKGGEELLQQRSQELEQNLTFLGLTAMFDPPRPEVPQAIALCHRAGIQVTMVTGDYGLTAEAIAHQIGLIQNKTRVAEKQDDLEQSSKHPAPFSSPKSAMPNKTRVVTGEGMGHLSDAQLRQILQYRSGLVFARMSPEHKLRLVQAYKDLGQVVAVTGDGVNDAPALRAANIGIAMGMSGTDVAREAADIVLTDDNFATIVSAIEQGRAVYQNIRKFMTYILASNTPEIVPFLAMVALKIPPALTILQILAVDLGTDMVPALALGAERPETGIMERPPRSKHKPLLDGALLARAYGFLGVIEAILAMLGFFIVWWSHGYSLAELQQVTPAILARTADANVMAIYHQATTVTLAAIIASQVGNLFACRSEYLSAFSLNWADNRLLWLGIAVEWGMLLLFIHVPPLSRVFATVPLAPWQWLLLILCPPLLLGAEELRKALFRKRRLHSEHRNTEL
jgi:Ca2+-transporting ATPase